MIRNDKQYDLQTASLAMAREESRRKRDDLAGQDFTSSEIEELMGPIEGFQDDLDAETSEYRQIKAGYIPSMELERLGDMLIAARIACGWTQENLASQLEVTPSAVSQDEKFGYRGVTVAKACRLLRCLGRRAWVVIDSHPRTVVPTPDRLRALQRTDAPLAPSRLAELFQQQNSLSWDAPSSSQESLGGIPQVQYRMIDQEPQPSVTGSSLMPEAPGCVQQFSMDQIRGQSMNPSHGQCT